MVYLIFWVFFFGLFCRRSLSFVSRHVLRVGGTATLGLSHTRQRGCQNKSDSMYVTVTLEEKYNDIREIFDTIYLFCIFTSLYIFCALSLSLSLPLSPSAQVGGPSLQQAAVYEEFSRCLPGFLPTSVAKVTSCTCVHLLYYVHLLVLSFEENFLFFLFLC